MQTVQRRNIHQEVLSAVISAALQFSEKQQSPIAPILLISPFALKSEWWQRAPHHILIVPQWEAANLRDLHCDFQQVTERGFRTWAGHVPHTGVIQ